MRKREVRKREVLQSPQIVATVLEEEIVGTFSSHNPHMQFAVFPGDLRIPHFFLV